MQQHGISIYGAKSALLDPWVAGRRVLHLGAVGAEWGSPQTKARAAPESLHATITARAERCIGIDVDGDAVAAIREAGVFDNIIVRDVREVDRSEIDLTEIDTIVAGDIIEHVGTPGSVLEGLRRVADPETSLVITTPNAVGLPQFLRYARGHPIEGVEHQCSFNVYSLRNLLDAAGWHLASIATCHQDEDRWRKSRLGFRVGTALLRRVPALGGTLFAVATVGSGGEDAHG